MPLLAPEVFSQQRYGVPSRLGWLGIAPEPYPGMATMPVAAVPVNLGAYEPEDTPQVLLDLGLRANMGGVAGAVLGDLESAFTFGAPLFPDSGGYWLDNLLGDLSTTSGGTLGAPQALSSALEAGATQLTVATSLGSVATGSVIQISDGAASEMVIATAGSTGTLVQFTGTPCRFPHTTAATAAVQIAGGGYSHVFSVLSSGSGQPTTHTLTDITGLTTGVGARAYPGACVTQIDLAGDPGSGFITGKVTGVAWPSQPAAATPVFPQVVTVPLPGWRAAVYVDGVIANAGTWTVSMQRQTVVYRTAQGGQGPVVIARGGLTVTGTLTYPDPSDETPLSQMLMGIPMPVRITASDGLPGASAFAVTVSAASVQFTKAKPGRNTLPVSYADAWQAIDSAANAGGSGGEGPVQVTLVNNQATYSGPASPAGVSPAAILSAAAVPGLLVPGDAVPGTPADAASGTGGQPASKPPLSGFFAVNYFPAANAGPDMWSSYSHTQTAADMARAAGLGFNGMRVAVSATSGTFDFPGSPVSGGPTVAELANLQDFYTTAQAHGIFLHLALFDQFGGQFGQIGACQRWLTAILNALASIDSSLGQLEILETHNEVWTSSNQNQAYSGGYDSGWPAGVPQTGQAWDVGLVFASKMTDLCRQLAPGIPVTTSVPSAQGTSFGGLGFYYNGVVSGDPAIDGFRCSAPDFYDYHLYGGLSSIQSQLQTAQSVVAPAILRCGEFGWDVEGVTESQTDLADQATYAQNGRYYCQVQGISEPQWWMLFDVDPASPAFTSGQCDGLYTTSGSIKPCGQIYQLYPPGSTVPLQ